jgi:hypothetical protein
MAAEKVTVATVRRKWNAGLDAVKAQVFAAQQLQLTGPSVMSEVDN